MNQNRLTIGWLASFWLMIGILPLASDAQAQDIVIADFEGDSYGPNQTKGSGVFVICYRELSPLNPRA